jgi:uncharacterized protein YukE
VAGSQPDGLIAAAARLGSSIASLKAHIAAQREALGQLVSGWQGDAAQAAVLRAEKNLQRQLQLQVRLRAMQSALHGGGEQLSALRTQILSAAGQATSMGGLVSDDGAVRATGGGRFMTPALAAAYTALLKALLTQFENRRATLTRLRRVARARQSALHSRTWPHLRSLSALTASTDRAVTCRP